MTPRRSTQVGLRDPATDQGVALILVLLAMLLLSVLAASIVFTARSETFSSSGYRLNTQADYVAKAGIEAATNWFRSNHYAAVPAAVAGADYRVTAEPIYGLYTSNNSPVQCLANCASSNSAVQLIGYGGGSSNYPSGITNASSGSVVTTAFTNDLNSNGGSSGNGVLVSGDANHSGLFWVNAYLLNYQTVNNGSITSCSNASGAPPCPSETWLITVKGVWIAGASQVVATAEEQAIIQPVYSPSFGNALYGYCSVSMSGSAGTCTDAYNSALGPYGGGNSSVASGACDQNTTNVINSGANVGANGYVSMSNNVTVSGNVVIGNANPNLVPSSCCSGSSCGPPASGNVTGSIITGAPYVSAPAVPAFPGSGQTGTAFPGASPSYSNTTASVPQTSSSNSASPAGTITPGSNSFAWPCISGATCNGSAANPYLINSISLSGNGQNVTLYGGPSISQPVYYDLDTLSLAGNHGSITVTGYVVLNVKTSLDVEGQGLVNSLNVPPEAVQINYAGTSAASVGGNGGVSAIITAPLASVSLHGGGSGGFMTGAIRALNITALGGFPVHYDVELNRLDGLLGQMMRSSYTRIKQ